MRTIYVDKTGVLNAWASNHTLSTGHQVLAPKKEMEDGPNIWGNNASETADDAARE